MNKWEIFKQFIKFLMKIIFVKNISIKTLSVFLKNSFEKKYQNFDLIVVHKKTFLTYKKNLKIAGGPMC